MLVSITDPYQNGGGGGLSEADAKLLFLEKEGDKLTSLTLKKPINKNDILLIEDSQDGFTKKKVKISDLVGVDDSEIWVAGTDYTSDNIFSFKTANTSAKWKDGKKIKPNTVYLARYATNSTSSATLTNPEMAKFVRINSDSSSSNIFDEDEDTGIEVERTTDDDTIRMKTNGSDRVTITKDGNVGIGTPTPNTLLSLNPKIEVDKGRVYDKNALSITHPTPTSSTALNDPKSLLYLGRDGTVGEVYGAMATFKIDRYVNEGINSRTRLDISLTHDQFNDVGVLALLSSGNVGISTVTPTANLHIKGGDTSLKLQGSKYTGGIKLEAGGEIMDIGLNYTLLGDRIGSQEGGFFRIDTRPSRKSEFMAWYRNASSSNLLAKLSYDGDMQVLHDFKAGHDIRALHDIVADNNLGIGTTTPQAPIEVVRNDASIKLRDVRTSGMKSEVDGQLVDFGVNYHQLGGDFADARGGFFRIDVRPRYSANFFCVYKQPENAGRSQQAIFQVGYDGRLTIVGGNPSTGAVLISTNNGGLSEWKDSSTLFTRGNSAGSSSATQLFFGWNNTSTYRHSIQTDHDGNVSANNKILFKVWNKGLSSTAIPTVNPLTLTGANQVGIGTNAPTTTLDVNGQIRMRGGSPSLGKVLISTDNDGNTEWKDSSDLFTRGNSASETSITQLFFGWNNTDRHRHSIQTQHDGNSSKNKMLFKVWSKEISATAAPIVNPLTLTGDNKVGIGTDTPTSTLDVNGDARLRGGLLDGDNKKGNNGQILFSTGSKTRWINLPPTSNTMSDADGDTSITVEESADIDQIRMKAGGTLAFIVKGSGQITTGSGDSKQLIVGRNSNTAQQLVLGVTSSGHGTIEAIHQGIAYKNIFLAKDGGNVGIGTTSPTTKIDINGQIRIRGGSPSTDKVLISDADGLATWGSMPSSFQRGNNSGSNAKTQISFGWNNTSTYRHSIQTEHDSGASEANKILFKVWNKTLDSTAAPTVNPLTLTGDNKVGIGTNTPTAELHVDGYTKHGNDSPAIKTKKLTGTTASTQDAVVSIAHGLGSEARILSATGFINFGSYGSVAIGFSRNDNEYNTSVGLDDTYLYIFNNKNESGKVLSKPFRLLVTYEA